VRYSVTLLQYEHGLIRQVTDVLAELVKRNDLEKHRKEAQRIARFLDEFMDHYHHAKEEKFLFPAGSKAVGGMRNEMERLLDEHRKARALISKMKRQSGDRGRALSGEFAVTSKQLVDHITAHVRFEEDAIFPRFEEALSLEQDEKLAEDYMAFLSSEFDADFTRRSENFVVRIQDEVLGPGYYQGIR
jgi:hemerythrin-like domain-containing protein